MDKEKNVAIVLCAGRGTRMNSEIQKQYLLIKGKPVVYYSLYAFEMCPFMDEVVLVTGKDEIEYCRQEIVEKYGLKKVKFIVAGGKERYHSVFEGLKAIKNSDYVYIHDGARPFIDQELLQRACDSVHIHKACVVGMPVKDTIKIISPDGFAQHTPDRSTLWMVQTPQVFQYQIVLEAYENIMRNPGVQVTDDAMVVEKMGKAKIKLVEGSYKNIKITTPEDLEIAEIFCKDKM